MGEGWQREKMKEAARRETRVSRKKKVAVLVFEIFGVRLLFCFEVSAKAGDEKWRLV